MSSHQKRLEAKKKKNQVIRTDYTLPPEVL
jgi:hypothetical protein